MKIFGTPVSKSETPSPVIDIDFENGTGDLKLSSGASVDGNGSSGKGLRLDGSDSSYAELPAGLLDGCRDYTVSMDIKSDSEGNFFTFAAGKNDEKYVFFRVAKDTFRFAATTDSWRDETVIERDTDGTGWHNYTMVFSGATSKLYIDGKFVSETTETHGQIADMGSGTSCYIGKSYYGDDACFKGEIDNLKIYKCALTDAEITGSAPEVPAPVKGDVNNDGQCNVADLIAMQSFLLGRDSLAAPMNGDLCGDEVIDVFDMIALRKHLLS